MQFENESVPISNLTDDEMRVLINSSPDLLSLQPTADKDADVKRVLPMVRSSGSIQMFVNAIKNMANGTQESKRSMKNIVITLHYLRLSTADQGKVRTWVQVNSSVASANRPDIPTILSAKAASNLIGYIDTERFLSNVNFLKYLISKYYVQNTPAVDLDFGAGPGNRGQSMMNSQFTNNAYQQDNRSVNTGFNQQSSFQNQGSNSQSDRVQQFQNYAQGYGQSSASFQAPPSANNASATASPVSTVVTSGQASNITQNSASSSQQIQAPRTEVVIRSADTLDASTSEVASVTAKKVTKKQKTGDSAIV